MMKIKILVVLVLVGFVAITPCWAKDTATIPDRRVAVYDLTIASNYGSFDPYYLKQWLKSLIEAKMVNKGFTIVARDQTMKNIQAEQNNPYLDPRTRLSSNKLWGATAVMDINVNILYTSPQPKDILCQTLMLWIS